MLQKQLQEQRAAVLGATGVLTDHSTLLGGSLFEAVLLSSSSQEQPAAVRVGVFKGGEGALCCVSCWAAVVCWQCLLRDTSGVTCRTATCRGFVLCCARGS